MGICYNNMRVRIEDIKIRKAEKKDIPFIVDIKISGWQSAYADLIDDKYLDNLNNGRGEKIAKMEADFNSNGFIVAELDGEVVGFCRYVTDNSFSPEIKDADCELTAIYVRSDLKYFGIGAKMFRYVRNEFRKLGKTKMVLWCLKDNEPSKKFYSKMGGKIIKEKTVRIGDVNYTECCFSYNLWLNKYEGAGS